MSHLRGKPAEDFNRLEQFLSMLYCRENVHFIKRSMSKAFCQVCRSSTLLIPDVRRNILSRDKFRRNPITHP
ncbi:MAG TPA: hypothetical protein VN361_04165 [Oxalicibacterium sp.]|nr:hypothetical protein [Oxalicibacterium sp.]